jgi:hypothetical protein
MRRAAVSDNNRKGTTEAAAHLPRHRLGEQRIAVPLAATCTSKETSTSFRASVSTSFRSGTRMRHFPSRSTGEQCAVAAQPIRQMWPSVGVRSSVGMRPSVGVRSSVGMRPSVGMRLSVGMRNLLSDVRRLHRGAALYCVATRCALRHRRRVVESYDPRASRRSPKPSSTLYEHTALQYFPKLYMIAQVLRHTRSTCRHAVAASSQAAPLRALARRTDRGCRGRLPVRIHPAIARRPTSLYLWGTMHPGWPKEYSVGWAS